MTMEEWKAQKSAQAQAAAEASAAVQEPPKQDKGKKGPSTKEELVTEEPEYIAPKGDGMPTMAAGGDATANISLILGMLAIIFGVFFGGAPWIGMILGIGSIIMGIIYSKKSEKEKRKKGVGGLVCGIIGLLISALVGLGCLALDISAGILQFILRLF